MEFNSGGYGGAGCGGNDLELLCKTLQVEHKLFYFNLKENPRSRYLKISEKTSGTRSIVIVPFNGISWFFDNTNYYVTSDDQDISSKEVQFDSKVFYFDIEENRRGRFLKVSGASVSRNRSTIIVPAESTRDEGWCAFRNIMEETNKESKLFVLPIQENGTINKGAEEGANQSIRQGQKSKETSVESDKKQSEVTSCTSSSMMEGQVPKVVLVESSKIPAVALGSSESGHVPILLTSKNTPASKRPSVSPSPAVLKHEFLAKGI
ncbi:hypothetical protein Lser_V15G17883 [Lactuca serriola]